MEFEAAAGFGVSEPRCGGLVEDEGGFEAGAGEGVFDACDFFAEVEALGLRFLWVEMSGLVYVPRLRCLYRTRILLRFAVCMDIFLLKR